jgi:hypothetical protein
MPGREIRRIDDDAGVRIQWSGADADSSNRMLRGTSGKSPRIVAVTPARLIDGAPIVGMGFLFRARILPSALTGRDLAAANIYSNDDARIVFHVL